jgi:HSP20 family molecular chaperone IbpA
MTQQQARARTADVAANVYDTPGGDAYVVEIPVPDARADEIGVEATVDTVTVTVRSQSRVFEFPMDLDTDRVSAELKDGVLRIEAPKAVVGKRRVVPVEQVV